MRRSGGWRGSWAPKGCRIQSALLKHTHTHTQLSLSGQVCPLWLASVTFRFTLRPKERVGESYKQRGDQQLRKGRGSWRENVFFSFYFWLSATFALFCSLSRSPWVSGSDWSQSSMHFPFFLPVFDITVCFPVYSRQKNLALSSGRHCTNLKSPAAVWWD